MNTPAQKARAAAKKQKSAARKRAIRRHAIRMVVAGMRAAWFHGAGRKLRPGISGADITDLTVQGLMALLTQEERAYFFGDPRYLTKAEEALENQFFPEGDHG